MLDSSVLLLVSPVTPRPQGQRRLQQKGLNPGACKSESRLGSPCAGVLFDSVIFAIVRAAEIGVVAFEFVMGLVVAGVSPLGDGIADAVIAPYPVLGHGSVVKAGVFSRLIDLPQRTPEHVN